LLRAETFYRYQIMLRMRAMSKLSQTTGENHRGTRLAG